MSTLRGKTMVMVLMHGQGLEMLLRDALLVIVESLSLRHGVEWGLQEPVVRHRGHRGRGLRE